MLLALVIGLLLVLALAGVMIYSPKIAAGVGLLTTAGLFLLVVLIGAPMIGEKILSWVR